MGTPRAVAVGFFAAADADVDGCCFDEDAGFLAGAAEPAPLACARRSSPS